MSRFVIVKLMLWAEPTSLYPRSSSVSMFTWASGLPTLFSAIENCRPWLGDIGTFWGTKLSPTDMPVLDETIRRSRVGFVLGLGQCLLDLQMWAPVPTLEDRRPIIRSQDCWVFQGKLFPATMPERRLRLVIKPHISGGAMLVSFLLVSLEDTGWDCGCLTFQSLYSLWGCLGWCPSLSGWSESCVCILSNKSSVFLVGLQLYQGSDFNRRNLKM